MYRISYDKITESDKPSQVALHNLQVADKYLHEKLMSTCVRAWIKANPNKNYQNLEKTLRSKKLNTHLLAKPIDVKDNMKIAFGADEKKYECECICKKSSEALEEILEYWPTYAKNFNALADSGDLISELEFDKRVAISAEPAKKKDPAQQQEEQAAKVIDKDPFIDVEDNKVKVAFYELSSLEFIAQVEQNLRDKYGRKPDHTVIAKTKDGFSIVGMFMNNMLASNYGYKCSEDGKQVDIVDLTLATD